MIASIIGSIIDKALDFIPKPEDRAKLEMERAKMAIEAEKQIMDFVAQQNVGQMEVNKVEAANSNIFVSGWRPFVGWGCGAAFLYHYLIQPLLAFILAANGHSFPLPAFDLDAMMTVLMGILGLGGMRSFEKLKGLTK